MVEIAWLTPAAVIGLAGVIVRIAIGYRSEMQTAREEQRAVFESRLADQRDETRHRELLLEKVLGVLQEHNVISQRTLTLIKEIREISGQHRQPPTGGGS